LGDLDAPNDKLFGAEETRFRHDERPAGLFRNQIERIGGLVACFAAATGDPDETWLARFGGARGTDRLATLTNVNDIANRVPYRREARDHWAAPPEFFAAGAGDCEDFAVAKYMALRRLEGPDFACRIAVVHDNARNQGHAVLAVYEAGRILILDNQVAPVRDSRLFPHYRALYSIDDAWWWRHGGETARGGIA
jgi:predicted transglutaminase-like cysteine proteinase